MTALRGEIWIRIAGVLVAAWGAVLLALIGAFLTPLRIGSFLVPVAIVLVVGGNWLLVRWTHEVTGHLGLSLLPGLAWLAVTLVLSGRTTEGDLVLVQSNWVANVYLLAGSVTVGLAAYRLINPRRRPPSPTP